MSRRSSRFISIMLIVVLTMGLVPLVGLISPGVASAVNASGCPTVSGSVYSAVYSPDTGMTKCSSTDTNELQEINLSIVNLEAQSKATYDFMFVDPGYKGQSLKIVDVDREVVSEQGFIDSETGTGHLFNVPVEPDELLFAVIGNNGEKTVPIGYFYNDALLIKVNIVHDSRQPVLKSLKNEDGSELTIISPAAGHYYLSNVYDDYFDALIEETVNGEKHYYMSQIDIYNDYEPGPDILRQIELDIDAQDWHPVTSSFRVTSVVGSQVLSINNQFNSNSSHRNYSILNQDLSDYNATVHYFIPLDESIDLIQYVEIQTTDHTYILSKPVGLLTGTIPPLLTPSPSTSPSPTPTPTVIRLEGDPGKMKSVSFKTESLDSDVSADIGLSFATHAFELIESSIDIQTDRTQTIHYQENLTLGKISYFFNGYYFERSEFLAKQLAQSQSSELTIGEKVTVFDVRAGMVHENNTRDYFPTLRTVSGDVLSLSDMAEVPEVDGSFQLYQEGAPSDQSSIQYYWGNFSIRLDDIKGYSMKFTHGQLDESIFNLGTNVKEVDVPLVFIQVALLNDAGLPSTEPYAHKSIYLESVYPQPYYTEPIIVETDENGRGVTRNVAYGLWKVKTVPGFFVDDYVQTSNADIDGYNFNKAVDGNLTLNAIRIRTEGPSSSGPITIKDLVRFSKGLIESRNLDFNQDGLSNKADYQYLQSLTTPHFHHIPD